MTTPKTTGKMIGPLVGMTGLPQTAELIESKETARGALSLYKGNDDVAGFAPRYYVAAAGFYGASTEANCRKVYDATK